MIDQYQETPGSDGLEFQANPKVTLQLTKFAWTRALVRDPIECGGPLPPGRSAGSIDARLDALAWGAKSGTRWRRLRSRWTIYGMDLEAGGGSL